MIERSAAELAAAVRDGTLRAGDLVAQSLARIDAASHLGAFLSVAHDSAREAADRIDERARRGEPLGPLCGVPIAVKDALCTVDLPTTAASRILTRDGASPKSGWRPPYDATVVERLRAADAIVIGKTNMDEFAMGSSNENSGFGPAKNPWDPRRTPGGSSGGSAVAVAAGLAPLALGSDTGGSIRQPAALTGVVGIKPSYGRVSRYGLIAFASSLDQVGPFARDVRGAAQLLSVIAGADPRDSTAASTPVGDYVAACGRGVAGLRLGIPKQYFAAGLDAEVERNIRDAIAALEREGCQVIEVDLPHTRYGIATYYILATAEASSNLARFDGVRFGLRREPRADLGALYGATRDAGFGTEVKRRILLGTFVLSAGYYDAYYEKAQRVRTLVQRDFEAAFARVDALVTPTSPTPAFPLGERTDDPLAMYLSDVFTLPASLAGVAALSLPVGLTAATAERPPLPIGMQLIGPAFSEERLLSLAGTYEALSPVRDARPPEPT